MGIVAPPYRLETERLVLRCWEPRDAPLLKEAVESSIDHLRPWMPWTPDKPEPLDDYVERLRGFRASFDRNENFIYGAFSPDEQRVLGGTGLHERVGERALEIGYWIRGDAVRQGLATELSAVLTRVAFERCGVDRVEIRVEPANAASARVPRKLGYLEEATLRRRLPGRTGEPLHDVVIFSMLVEELAASPCAAARYRAFDAAGREQPAAPARPI